MFNATMKLSFEVPSGKEILRDGLAATRKRIALELEAQVEDVLRDEMLREAEHAKWWDQPSTEFELGKKPN